MPTLCNCLCIYFLTFASDSLSSHFYDSVFEHHSGHAIVSAVTSGSKRFFLGTDSAPHERRRKECPCGCAGIYSAPVALPLYAKVFEEVLTFSNPST